MYRTRDLLADGASVTQVRRIRRELSQVTWGFHVDPLLDPWERYRLKCQAVLQRLADGAALAGPSAAVYYRVPLLGPPPDKVFVTNIRQGTYARDVKVLPAAPVTDIDGVAVTTPPAMVGQSSWLLDPGGALVIADGALALELCTRADLRSWAELQEGRRFAGRARWLAAQADGKSDSPGETLTRLIVTDLGYDVVSQFKVELSERLAFIDLLVEGTQVAIEFDGLVKYRKRGLAKVLQEHLREGELQALGYAIVRLVWHQLDDVEQLDRRLRAAGAQPVRRRRHAPW